MSLFIVVLFEKKSVQKILSYLGNLIRKRSKYIEPVEKYDLKLQTKMLERNKPLNRLL